MKTIALVALAILATLAYSHLHPTESQKAGGEVIQATKKAQVIGAREGKKALNVARQAIHQATAQDGGVQ